MGPDGIEELASAQGEFARRILVLNDERDAHLEARLRNDRAVSARERVQVYTHAYFARIHQVLRADFGALCAALGEDAFHDLAKLYLMAHPSRSFSLRFAGERLAAFLVGPIGEPFRRWPFAADLARLEWAIADVFDAADAPSLPRDALRGFDPGAWAELRFALAPAQRLLWLDWPVQRLRAAWDADQPLPALEPAATRLLVYRRDERVLHREVSDGEARALESLQRGEDFGAVCEQIAQVAGEEGAATRALALLERWLAEGLLSAVDV